MNEKLAFQRFVRASHLQSARSKIQSTHLCSLVCFSWEIIHAKLRLCCSCCTKDITDVTVYLVSGERSKRLTVNKNIACSSISKTGNHQFLLAHSHYSSHNY